jgi:hypothetical protein
LNLLIIKYLKYTQVKNFFILPVFILSLSFTYRVSAIHSLNDSSYVCFQSNKSCFELLSKGRSATIIVSNTDYKGIKRCANDLRDDIKRVSGITPSLINSFSTHSKINAIIIGSVEKSDIIQQLIRNNKLKIDSLKGTHESFIIEVIDRPFKGINQALVIAGVDKRGTIYGIYDLSSRIGVSPWYWWADMPIIHHDDIYIKPVSYFSGEPRVKYRGIFINDEAPALSGWAWEKFGGFNHRFYSKVFELILRLKGNYLWPAMWGNAFFVDDTLNGPLADEYGIVIGTSHHEPMLRAHAEWAKYGKGPWNYQLNDSILKKFWRESLLQRKSYETTITIGMRGNGDEPMSENSNIALLEKIVSDQRQIIKEVTDKSPSETPQVWALYKEVQDYYDKGMRVPDDVILLLSDDNWGNIRKLPSPNEVPHKGGYGVYYHFDYVGGPRNYKWINTNQIEKTWEQMNMAYEYGVDKIWIVNVGDIKPMEFPMEFFLDLAWNPNVWNADNIHLYYHHWASEYFGKQNADIIARGLKLYTKYNSRVKPELLSANTYSLVNYREADSVVANYSQLCVEEKLLYNQLPDRYKDAFYQLVLHPIEASANLYELYYAVAKNKFYASQNRSATNDWADKVSQFFQKDKEITNYYNHILSSGKWNHLMDQTHIGYTSWQQPDSNILPETLHYSPSAGSSVGVWIEGSSAFFPQESVLKSPELNNLTNPNFYFEIFNQGKVPFLFFIERSDSFIHCSTIKDTINKEKKITVSIDWSSVPEGKTFSKIFIHALGKAVEVCIPLYKPYLNEFKSIGGFVETSGYVSIEAEHFNKCYSTENLKWKIIENLGRTSSSVMVKPSLFSFGDISENTPMLSYNFYCTDTGGVKLSLYLSPSLNFNANKGLKFSVSIDDEKPQTINIHEGLSELNWEKMVASNILIKTIQSYIHKSGQHTIKFWMLDGGIVLEKIVIDFGGVKDSYLGPPESYRVH